MLLRTHPLTSALVAVAASTAPASAGHYYQPTAPYSGYGGPYSGPFYEKYNGYPGLAPHHFAPMIEARPHYDYAPPPPVTAAAPNATVAPVVPASLVAAGGQGVRIVELTRGPARDGGLRNGDLILSIDGKRTRTFDDVRAALAASPGKSSVEFVDAATGRVESRAVAVVGGRIGITVVEAAVPAGAGSGQ